MKKSRQSNKSFFVATGLTISAITLSLITVSTLLGTIFGLVFIGVIITGLVFLGTLYTRLLMSFSFFHLIKNEIQASKKNMKDKEVETSKMDSPVREIYQEKIYSKINNIDPKKPLFNGKEELEKTTPVIPETQSAIIISQREKPKVLENTKSQEKTLGPKKENHKNASNDKEDILEGCNNFLGYLRTLQKGASTPDECFACARLIDCHKKSTFDF